MKKFSLLALAAAGLLLGACSDKNEVVQENPVTSVDSEEGAYIGISLSLPNSANITRANEDYDDGNASGDEWNVKNATLYVFKLTNNDAGTLGEGDALFQAYYTMGTDYTKDVEGATDTENITATYCNATLIGNDLAKDIADNKNNTKIQYFAYVILNHNGQVTAPTKDDTKFSDFTKQQFSSIGADIAAECNIHDGGLLMTSAPVADQKGGDAAPIAGTKYTTLVNIDKNKVYGSPKDATDHPAACIYVERAAVKITVSLANAIDASKTGGTAPTINSKTVTFDGWQIINYEKKYYNNRQIDQDKEGNEYIWKDGETSKTKWGGLSTDQTLPSGYSNNLYRFVSYAKFDPQLPSNTGHTEAFRTYFAKDINYGNDQKLEKPQANLSGPWIPFGNSGYTTENTFDVEHQTWKNTTMVTVKATIGNEDFYTIADGQEMYDYANTKTKIASDIFNDATVSSAINTLIEKIALIPDYDSKEVRANLTANFTAPTASKVGIETTITPNVTVDGSAIEKSTLTPGDAESDEVKTKKNDAISAWNDLEDAISAVRGKFLPNLYKGGVAYYNARIQHFGEIETPWSAGGVYISGDGSDINEIYGPGSTDAEKGLRDRRFLGRYGVVRDNWYKLEIESVNKIGTAEPIDVSTTHSDTPDDQIENYISVHVHIVPWVVRNQSVKF